MSGRYGNDMDDNPFADMPDDPAAGTGYVPPRPPKAQPSPPAPPRPAAPARPPRPAAPYMMTTGGDAEIDVGDYNRRLAELEERERAVAERERQVAEEQRSADKKMETAQKALEAQADEARHAPNWPPCFPKKLVYQNFEEEIPPTIRTRVEMAYWHTMGLFFFHTFPFCPLHKKGFKHTHAHDCVFFLKKQTHKQQRGFS